jgi:hypothetical protein
MSETQANQPSPNSKTRMRSPAYPFFGLGEAIKKARDLWDAQRNGEGHLDSVVHALGYNGRNGASLRAIAALNHFGLTEESGSKDNRRIRLTDLAQDIIHLPDEDEKKVSSLKKAALMPTIHQVLWERYQSTLPSDATIKSFLIRDKSYNESATLDVIKNYRESFDIAKLGDLIELNPSAPKDVNEVKPPIPETSSITTATVPQRSHSSIDQAETPLSRAAPISQELPILVDHGQVARIPFPMSEEAFDLLIGTLNLWKKKLVQPPSQ